MKILVVNAGSSTYKCSLYELAGSADSPIQVEPPRWEAKLDVSHAADHAELTVRTSSGATVNRSLASPDRHAALLTMFDMLVDGPTKVLGALGEIEAVGHRVVHGGERFEEPTVIDDDVVTAIEELVPLAPAHNPVALEAIVLLRNLLSGIPQVAVFDTAFHRRMPRAAMIYPGPFAWYERGMRRFGFHGINYAYLAQRIPLMLARDPARLRIVACHLGNGASVAAIVDGRSVDTTMGFTPLEGIMMGTRSGTVDPGLLLYLLHQGESVDALDDELQNKSGLLGLSGVSGDMRSVLEAETAGNERAALALDVYVHRLAAAIGAMTVALGGLDVLAFTGGIGEHAASVRERTCSRLGHLGVSLDTMNNAEASQNDRDVAGGASRVRVLVVTAQEDWMIARSCAVVLSPLS